MTSRLFRSIVVFGTTMGAGAGVIAVASGCDLYFGTPKVDAGPHGIIDASTWGTIADGPWGIIDAPRIIDAGIRDAPDAQIDGGSDVGSGSGSAS